MKRRSIFGSWVVIGVATLAWLPATILVVGAPIEDIAPAEDNVPPAGYVALFDGKSLDGWYGMPHQDPYEWAAMSDEQ